jgi:hypothetical protein
VIVAYNKWQENAVDAGAIPWPLGKCQWDHANLF